MQFTKWSVQARMAYGPQRFVSIISPPFSLWSWKGFGIVSFLKRLSN